MIAVPDRLRELSGFPGADEWLARVPRLAAECAERWSLDLGEPFPYANVSLALPARLPDGSEAVLKVAFPHWESEHEPAALAHWDGRGAVRLLEHDRERNALLLERCRPGGSLLDLPEEDGYRLAADVLATLSARPAPDDHPFTPIAETAARWARELPRAMGGRGAAVRAPPARRRGGRARRAPPEPARARRVPPGLPPRQRARRASASRGSPSTPSRSSPSARSTSPPFSRDGPGDAARRLDFLVDRLALDRERARGWGIAHTIAWGFDEHEPRVHSGHVELARALLAAP